MSKKCYDGKSKGGTEAYEKEKTTEEKRNRGGDTGQYLVKGSHRICYRCGSGYLYGGQHQSECPEERPGEQSKAAAYQLEIFFEEYTTVVEQMALNTDVQTLLEETGPGANITESERYATVFNSMKKTVAADSDNIQAVWVGDIDAKLRHSQTAIPVAVISRSQSVHGIRQ